MDRRNPLQLSISEDLLKYGATVDAETMQISHLDFGKFTDSLKNEFGLASEGPSINTWYLAVANVELRSPSGAWVSLQVLGSSIFATVMRKMH